MPIRVITLEREYGSGGGEIAASIAARLGWKLWDQLLTEEIARLPLSSCASSSNHFPTPYSSMSSNVWLSRQSTRNPLR